MKTVLGCLRKADKDFNMIAPGDRIAVGVSGGKDSLVLLRALALYRLFSHTDYHLEAVTVSMGLEPFDTSGVSEMCRELDIPYTVKQTEIGKIIFEERQEKNPCALCAKMRRGVLNDTAKELGCNKLALGHNREDALETLLMSTLFEGRLHTFQPVTYLSRTGMTVIRPMLYVPEKHVVHVAKDLNLPVVKSPCPANGETSREEMKNLLRELARRYPDVEERMLNALRNQDQYSLWNTKPILPQEIPKNDGNELE